MQVELTREERLERRRVVDSLIASEGSDDETFVADLEAYARGEVSLDELSVLINSRAELASQKILAEAEDEARRLLEKSALNQEKIIQDGQQEAARIRAEVGGPADRLKALLDGSTDAPEAIRNLILHGTPEQTQLAAKYIATSAGGYVALDGSVRKILLSMGELELRETWFNRIRPMLAEGKMLPAELLQKLDADVDNLLRLFQERPSLVWKHKYGIGALVTACVILFVLRFFSWS